MKKINLFHIVLLSLILGCNKDYVQETPSERSRAKRVNLKKLEPAKDPVPINASGLLKSESEINLSFKTGGIVESVLTTEGDLVQKGDLLASIDMEEIEAKVKQAQNAFEKAKRDLERVKNLYADSVATLEQKQDAETGLEVAEADLNIATFNLKHSKINAPVTGRILSRRVELQELVSPGQTAFVLASASNGDQKIEVGLSDKDIVKVRIRDSASISFDALPAKIYKASVAKISEAANPRTGTYKIELKLSGQYHNELKNGFVAKVELFTKPDSAYYKIPMSALVEADKTNATVFMSEDRNVAIKKVFRINTINRDHFTVLNAQSDDPSWIVLDGAAYLSHQDSIIAIN